MFYTSLTKVDDFWEPAKKQLLMDAKGFMDSLVRFDKDNIPDRIIKKARKEGGKEGRNAANFCLFMFVYLTPPFFDDCIDRAEKKSAGYTGFNRPAMF